MATITDATANPKSDALREQLSQHLKHWQGLEILSAYTCLENVADWPKLVEVLHFCQKNLGQTVTLNFTPQQHSTESWCTLERTLFNQSGQLRKRFTKREGLPSNDETAKAYKAWLIKFIAQINDPERLANHLKLIRLLGDTQYSDTEWEQIKALLQVLPLLAAELQLAFSKEQKYDYIEIAGRAKALLDHGAHASDATLQLDHTIHHLMIDEYQDTSLSQYQLLSQLVSHWAQHQHKTIFCVVTQCKVSIVFAKLKSVFLCTPLNMA